MNMSISNITSKGFPEDEAASSGQLRAEPTGPQEAGRPGWERPEPGAAAESGGEGAEAVSGAGAGRGAGESHGGYLGSRLIRVVVVLVVYFVLELLVKAAMVLQFVYVAWKKRPHLGMQRFGASVGEYMNALWRFCTFASDEAPWPFRPWPREPAGPEI